MGVEMTLLRALAFHPRMPLPEPEAPPVQAIQAAPAQQAAPASAPSSPPPNLPQTTSQVLAARSQLQRSQGAPTPKKSEPAAASRARPVNNAALERLSSITERVQARPAAAALEKAPAKKEAYRWKSTTVVEAVKEEVATPKALKKRWSMKKRRNWRQSWQSKRSSAIAGRRKSAGLRYPNWWSRSP